MTVTLGRRDCEPASSETRVLVVDDEPEFVTLVRQYVETKTNATHVVTATDPRCALRLVEEEAFDCVITDYDMPEMNGHELVDEIRQQETELPVVVFTNVHDDAVERGTRERGATYLPKSGNPYDDLTDWVDAVTAE